MDLFNSVITRGSAKLHLLFYRVILQRLPTDPQLDNILNIVPSWYKVQHNFYFTGVYFVKILHVLTNIRM